MTEQNNFFDEKILEYRNRARKEKYSTLETGMYIKNELVQFKRTEIFHNKMSIMLPATFVTLPSNLAKLKYTSELRPQIIKTSLDTTVNIGFSMSGIRIRSEQIKTVLNQGKEAMKRLNPAMVFYESGVKTEGVPLGFFEFKSYGLDSNVYNLTFIMEIDGKMAHGIFNCSYDDVVEWRDAAWQMMSSIADISKEGNDERTKNNSGTV